MPLIHHFLYNFCDSIRGATPPSQGTSAVNSTPGMTLNGNYCQKKFGVLVVNRRYCILHVYVVSTLVRKKKSYIYQKSIWLLQNFDIFFRRKKNNINTLCLEKKKSFSSPSAARAQTLTLRSLAKLTLLTDLFVDFCTLNAYFNSFALLECMKKKKKEQTCQKGCLCTTSLISWSRQDSSTVDKVHVNFKGE